MRLTRALVFGLATAAVPPARPQTPTPAVQQRSLLGTLEGILDIPRSGAQLSGALVDSLLEELSNLVPIATPTSPESAASAIASIFASKPSQLADLVESSAKLVLSGLTRDSLKTLLAGYDQATINSDNNANPREPVEPIYPRNDPSDAPYATDEQTLRKWIHIPPSFTYGAKHPVILIPGTGERGGNAFAGNLATFLKDKPYADPVWLNPTGFMLDDAQINAEMVAYAVNYISGISGCRNVSLASISQGSVSGQWALKYWPSARRRVSNFVPVSPDYKGTFVAPVLCSPLYACPYSLVQQDFNSSFVRALARDGGSSAYVPTTNIYSSFFDEIVEPQEGSGASGRLRDERGVGVRNVDVQQACAGQNAAGLYTHENAILHPLVPALLADALTRGGPGRVDRLDLGAVCSRLFGDDGTTLEDVINTESIIPVALYKILAYKGPRTSVDPPLFAYARRG